MFTPRARHAIFNVFIVFAACTTVYHTVGTFIKINEMPPWRNALFIGVNLICIYGYAKLPRWFVVYFGLLLVQQYYAHGSDIVSLWHASRRVDWIGVGVLLVFPVGFLALVSDARARMMQKEPTAV